jgi:DNA polymerase
MERLEVFNRLALEAARCRRCERMCERRAVLSHLNGRLGARLMFIAEAPGRQGADRTRIPFGGDASGANFDALLASIRLRREEIFITNAVLCNPRQESGANDKPTRAEVRNCSDFLRRQIALVNPRVVATLGAVALDALRLVEPHPYQLRETVAQLLPWNGRLLVPLYHPSPRVINALRPLATQVRDYRALRRALKLAGN